MAIPTPEDAAVATTEAITEGTAIPMTVTIDAGDGEPEVMFFAVCPQLVAWGPGIENIVADCFEMLSTFLTGRRSTEA